MNLNLNQLHTVSINIESFALSAYKVIHSPTMFLLFGIIILDVISGVGATLVVRKGLDSSISFKGFIKHTFALLLCFIVEFLFYALTIAMTFPDMVGSIGHFITLLAITSYFASVIGNAYVIGLIPPDWMITLFKAEINRKVKKYLG